ncbi:uncharacterized protein JCM10292_005089 [Rhodotorula paludigena]|uniref:uncharacterized protein n=1 Tax=Rhodotorula paludigena TaxID=86838 RepID=UPI003181089D
MKPLRSPSPSPYRPPRPCTLPLDVCELVADAVLSLPAAVASQTLRALSLVSRGWTAAAQSALHRNPWLSFDAPDTVPPRTYARLEALGRTLAARPDLARGVQALDLGRYTARCQTEAKVDRRLVSRLSVALVSACPALKRLSIPFVTHVDKMDLVVALRELSMLETFVFGEGAATPEPWVIHVDVSIQDTWGTARWTRADFAALSTRWPRLKSLVLDARVRGREDDKDGGVPWVLESFELALIRNTKLSFAYLDKLLAGCRQGSLRRLVLKEHQFEPGALLAFLEQFGQNVDVLVTSSADRVNPDKALVAALPSVCPHLRMLRLASPIASNVPDALQQLSQLSHLTHLTLSTITSSLSLGNAQLCVDHLRGFARLEEVELLPGPQVEGSTNALVVELLQMTLREVVNRWNWERAHAHTGS